MIYLKIIQFEGLIFNPSYTIEIILSYTSYTFLLVTKFSLTYTF